MDQALDSQKTPHTSPLRASYGMSFVSILMKNDRVIKGFYWFKSSTWYKEHGTSKIQISSNCVNDARNGMVKILWKSTTMLLSTTFWMNTILYHES